jgi:anti-sigma B factor antagonist
VSGEFHVSTTTLGDGVAGVAVVGEADIYTAPELKQTLNAAIEAGATYVLVDLSAATFIDSTTLGILMGAVRRLRPIGGEVAIACADPNICRIFEITLLDRVFAIFPTADEGLEHLLATSTGSARTA